MATRLPLAVCLLVLLLASACGAEPDGPPEEVEPQFFGVSPQEPASDFEITRMARGGVGSYHLLISWARVERTRASYDWSLYDGVMTALAAEGIEPVPYLFGTSPIFADDPATPPIRDAATFNAWTDFVKAAVGRYGPGGELWKTLARTRPDIVPGPPRTWEIWNEMNGPAFWDPAPDVGEYARLLKRTARVITDVDSDARIMTGGMFATPASGESILSFDYLAELYERRGIAEIVDVVGIHPYGPGIEEVELQLEETRKVIDDAGDDAGTYVTEIGWGSDGDIAGQLSKDPERQAELLAAAYRTFIERRAEWGLEGALWYAWRDPADAPPNCSWCPAAGLFDRDLDPKPSWEAFTEVAGGES